MPGPGTCGEQVEISLGSHPKNCLFLGYQFDLVSFACTPPRPRFDKIVTHHSYSIRSGHHCSEVAGLPTSSDEAVPLRRLHTREIFALRCQWDFNPSTNHRFVRLLPPARDNLHWWKLDNNVFRGSPIVPLEPEVRILMDASVREGWGTHMTWNTASGMWLAEELQAIQLANRRWLPELQWPT